MLKPAEKERAPTRFLDMGVVRVQGADAIQFLQGQLSNDVARLTAGRSVLAGLHNPQGRAIALLRLILAGPDEILALVPRELAATVVARLSKFVLRAKAKISDVSGEWAVGGVVEVAGAAPPGGVPPVLAGSAQVALARWLVVSRAAPSAEPHDAEESGAPHVGSPWRPLNRDEWHAADIAAGIPQIYAVTSEAFVAQMLNLDLLDGIAFDKGCYTGQEVIARAHYRGKVKRRMQRFRTSGPAKLSAGDSGMLSDGRHFKVVTAAQLSDGRCEFLAVAPLVASGADEEAPPAQAAGTAPLDAEPLPLPYSLPA